MAENDQDNEEYQFPDLDAVNPKNDDLTEFQPELEGASVRIPPNHDTGMKRRLGIVIGILVILLIVYKFLGYWFSGKQEVKQPTPPPVIATQPAPVVQPIQPTPAPQQPQALSQMASKVSALELSQQSLNSEVSNLGNQMNNLNGQLDQLTAEMNKMNQLISSLTAQLDQQSQEIASMRVHARPKVIHHAVKPAKPKLKYYIQAVIPGRAWLIASNGSTLTVREGSSVPRYGIVKLIDAKQGRVLMSSGAVIRFSQNDS